MNALTKSYNSQPFLYSRVSRWLSSGLLVIFLVTGSNSTLVPARSPTIPRLIMVERASADTKLAGFVFGPPLHAAINWSKSGGNDPIRGAAGAAVAAPGAPPGAPPGRHQEQHHRERRHRERATLWGIPKLRSTGGVWFLPIYFHIGFRYQSAIQYLAFCADIQDPRITYQFIVLFQFRNKGGFIPPSYQKTSIGPLLPFAL